MEAVDTKTGLFLLLMPLWYLYTCLVFLASFHRLSYPRLAVFHGYKHTPSGPDDMLVARVICMLSFVLIDFGNNNESVGVDQLALVSFMCRSSIAGSMILKFPEPLQS